MNHWEPKIWRQFDKNGMLEFQKIKRTPDGEWEDYYPEEKCKRCEAYKSLISALEKELSRYRSGEIR